MNREKITTSTITLGDVKLTGYKTSDGSWFMSLTGLGKVLGKSDSSPRDFLKSKYLKQALRETFRPRDFVDVNGSSVSGIPIEVVSLYIRRQDRLGNNLASNLVDALMNQSLELRLEASLPETSVQVKEAVNEVTKKYLDVQSERERQKQNQIQNYFQMWCEAKGMNPAYVHDYITSSVIGRKAKDSRELPLYSGMNFFVGLDHFQENENEEMGLISQIKDKLPKKFPRKKKDYNYKNYVDDVIQEITV